MCVCVRVCSNILSPSVHNAIFGRPFVKGTAPNFRPHVHCGRQTAGWIKMPPGMEVGLCVIWGPSTPKTGAQPPRNFQPMPIVANRLEGSRCHFVWR